MTHLEFHTPPMGKMETPLTAWKGASGLLGLWHWKGRGATAMLRCVSLNERAHEVAEPSAPPTSAHKESITSITPSAALQALLPTCCLRHCRWADALIYHLALLCGPPSTELVVLCCVSTVAGHMRTESRGKSGQICVIQEEKRYFGLTDSVLPPSWSLLSNNSSRVVFAGQRMVPEPTEKLSFATVFVPREGSFYGLSTSRSQENSAACWHTTVSSTQHEYFKLFHCISHHLYHFVHKCHKRGQDLTVSYIRYHRQKEQSQSLPTKVCSANINYTMDRK